MLTALDASFRRLGGAPTLALTGNENTATDRAGTSQRAVRRQEASGSAGSAEEAATGRPNVTASRTAAGASDASC